MPAPMTDKEPDRLMLDAEEARCLKDNFLFIYLFIQVSRFLYEFYCLKFSTPGQKILNTKSEKHLLSEMAVIIFSGTIVVVPHLSPHCNISPSLFSGYRPWAAQGPSDLGLVPGHLIRRAIS